MSDQLTFDKRMKSGTRLSHKTSNSHMYIPGKFSNSAGLSVHQKYSDLCISTDLPPVLEPSRPTTYSSSPPPPALSPASLSPTQLSSGVVTRTSSPSPPVIVAEIGSHSSASSGVTNVDHKFDHSSPNSQLVRLSNGGTAPRFNHLSSSTCSSSSSSTSSSSFLMDNAHHLSEKIPILEKISITLGSPIKPTDAILSPRLPLNLRDDSSDLVVHNDLTNVSNDLSSKATPISTNKPVKSTAVRRKTTKPSKNRKPRGKRKPKWARDSDSNDAVVPTKRQYNRTGNRGKRRSKFPSRGNNLTTSTESASYRRYLESPFLCLCQSGGTAATISKVASELVNQSQQKLTNTAALTDAPVASLDSNTATTTIPAHIVSPALRGFSGYSCNQLSIPSTCPLNPTLHNETNFCAPDFRSADYSECKSIFSGLTYRPHGQLKTRASSYASDISASHPWLCVFCGQDNHYLELGSLYGPYCLTEADKSQLPAEMIMKNLMALPTANLTPPLCSKKSRTSHQSPMGGTKRFRTKQPPVVTSAVTRSSAAQDRTNTATKGASLKLIIKAPSDANKLVNSIDAKPRISSDGEVWFHLECVLWAPGTFIQGDGNIGNLGEALQISLDAVCSHCDRRGAILSCCSRGCPLRYHYPCALLADCHLNTEQYSLLCKKHGPPA